MRRLLIRPGAIGDCILSFPALEHLRTEYTEVWISSAVVPLVQFANVVLPLISTGIELLGIGDLLPDERFINKVRVFDEVVSWYGTNRPEFRTALEDIGVPCRFYPALPPVDYTEHATDFFARQVGAPDNLLPHIKVDLPDRRNTVVIHPFSGGSRKNWPFVLYQKLAACLPCTVEWTAGPEEELLGAKRFDDLRKLAQWLCGAKLYIGNDSGITHLASALGVPVLALFGPTTPTVWGPRGRNVTIVRNNSLSQLELNTVLQIALPLLDKTEFICNHPQP